MEDFNKNRARKDGLATMCRESWKKYYKEKYYNTDKEKARLRKNNDKRRNEIREFVISKKENNPCADCGIKYPHYVMDFDHLRDKEFDIAHAMRSLISKDRIILEISKCELVCSNCHRERTYRRSKNL